MIRSSTHPPMFATLAVVVGVTSAANAFVLTNGNLEAVNPGAEPLATFIGWEESPSNNSPAGSLRNGAAFVSTTSLDGTLAAELLSGTGNGGAFRQSIPAPITSYSASWQFAVLGGGDAGDRVFGAQIRHGDIMSVNQINMRINASGALQIFGGGSFRTIAGLTANVTSDSGTSGAWDGETAAVNHFSLVADYATGKYSVTLNGNTAGNLSFYQGTAPTTTSGLAHLVFNGADSTKNFLVDNITVIPEPTAIPAMLPGMLLSLRRRRT